MYFPHYSRYAPSQFTHLPHYYDLIGRQKPANSFPQQIFTNATTSHLNVGVLLYSRQTRNRLPWFAIQGYRLLAKTNAINAHIPIPRLSSCPVAIPYLTRFMVCF